MSNGLRHPHTLLIESFKSRNLFNEHEHYVLRYVRLVTLLISIVLVTHGGHTDWTDVAIAKWNTENDLNDLNECADWRHNWFVGYDCVSVEPVKYLPREMISLSAMINFVTFIYSNGDEQNLFVFVSVFSAAARIHFCYFRIGLPNDVTQRDSNGVSRPTLCSI